MTEDDTVYQGIRVCSVDRIPDTSTTLIWHVSWGSDKFYPNPTWWQRRKIRMRMYRGRIRDAWLVLRGRAEIEEDW